MSDKFKFEAFNQLLGPEPEQNAAFPTDTPVQGTQETQTSGLELVGAAWDRYSTLRASHFIEEEKPYLHDVDENYNLDNYDELVAQVPEWDRQALGDILTERAVSADHATWLTDRFIQNRENERKIADYGIPGMFAAMGVAAFDPANILLNTITGPFAAVSKAGRLAAAAKFAGLSAAENAALEGVLVAGGQSQPEDVVTAALFGAGIGAGLGGILAHSAPGSAGAELAKDIAPKANKAIQDIDAAAIDSVREKPEMSLNRPPEVVKEVHAAETAQVDEVLDAARAADDIVVQNGLEANILDESILPSGSPKKGVTVLFARDGENVGAIETVEKPGGVLEVFNSQLFEEFRGKGLGKELYTRLIDSAKAKGYSKLDSDSSVSEAAARVWMSLKKAGYDVIDNRSKAHKTVDASGAKRYIREDKSPVFELSLEGRPEPIKRPIGEQPEVPVRPEPKVDPNVRLKEIEDRLTQMSRENLDEPVRPDVLDLYDDMKGELAFIEQVRSGEVKLDAAKRTQADVEFGASKRGFLEAFKKADPDHYDELFPGGNPKLDEFKAGFERAQARLKRLEKEHNADTKSYKAATKAFKREVDKLAEEKDALLDELERLNEAADLSAGASAARLSEEPLTKMKGDVWSWLVSYPKSRFTNWRRDMAARLGSSPNQVSRVLGDMLSEDSVAKANFEATGVSGTERSDLITRVAEAKYHRARKENYLPWMEEQGIPRWKRFHPSVQQRFAHDVTDAVEGKSNSPAAQKAAAAWTSAIKKVFEEAERGGVRGFGTDFQWRGDYVPRIHSWDKIAAAFRRFETTGNPHAFTMDGPVSELIFRGIRKAQPDIDPAVAEKIARNYVRKIRERANSINGRVLDMGTNSLHYMREILDEMEVDPDTIEYVLKLMDNAQDGSKAGRTARAKRRLLMDTDVELRVRDKDTGEDMVLRLDDLFERDADRLLGHYARSVGGLAAIANRTKNTPMHITSKADFDKWIREARKLEEVVQGRGNKPWNDTINDDVRMLEMMWNRLTGGRVGAEESQGMQFFRRTATDWNFVRVMNQVVFAQLAEIGNSIGTTGLRVAFRHMPAMGKIFKDMLTGKVDYELAGVIEDVMGLGTDRLRHNAGFKWDEDVGGMFLSTSKGVENFNYGMHLMKKATAYPMQALIDFEQKLVGVHLMQRMTDLATGGMKMTEALKRRVHGMGIDDNMFVRIQHQMNKYGVAKNGPLTKGSKLRNPMLERWDDFDARDALIHGVFRQARKAVQENDIGNTLQFQNSAAGSILLQFRSFMLVSWNKQFLDGVAYHDMQTFMQFSLSMLMAGLAYGMQTVAKSAGSADQERYLKKELQFDKVARAAFQRSTWGGVPASIMDNLSTITGHDPVFNFRSTGLSNNFAQGIPTVDLASKAFQAVRGTARAAQEPGYKFSRDDLRNWQYILPWSNMLGYSNAMNAIGSTLPKRSEY